MINVRVGSDIGVDFGNSTPLEEKDVSVKFLFSGFCRNIYIFDKNWYATQANGNMPLPAETFLEILHHG